MKVCQCWRNILGLHSVMLKAALTLYSCHGAQNSKQIPTVNYCDVSYSLFTERNLDICQELWPTARHLKPTSTSHLWILVISQRTFGSLYIHALPCSQNFRITLSICLTLPTELSGHPIYMPYLAHRTYGSPYLHALLAHRTFGSPYLHALPCPFWLLFVLVAQGTHHFVKARARFVNVRKF